MDNLQEMKDAALDMIATAVEELEFSIEEYKKDKTDEDWNYVIMCKQKVDTFAFGYRFINLITAMEFDLYHRYATELVRNAAEL